MYIGEALVKLLPPFVVAVNRPDSGIPIKVRPVKDALEELKQD